MKPGSLVRIVGSHSSLLGVIVNRWKVDEWWEVLVRGNQIIHWPESQMELVDESR